MPLTANHFDEIKAFLRDRIDPLLDGARIVGSDALMTALTALSKTVDNAHDGGKHVLTTGGWAPADRDQIVAEYWDRLSSLACEWEKHPDFQHDFELDADELGGVEALPAKP
ncbi:hypothetical protein AB0E27_41180 [Streptomyces sparsogenes]|uniref:hypothetical protein n=1 Tax=Streptomyces sparsogenes TaxID=67365 RepID=UPI0033EC8121